MNYKYFTCLLFLALNSTQAQEKKFTMAEATIGLYTNLAPDNLPQLTWVPAENAISRVVKTSYGQALVKQTIPNMQVDTLLRTHTLAKDISLKNTLKAFPQLEWINNKELYFALGNRYFIGKIDNGTLKVTLWHILPENAENVAVDKGSRKIAYTVANNLVLIDEAGKEHKITRDENTGIVNGKAVHRQEFGIHNGIFFSPQGRYLAFYRMDETMVEDYPIVDWDTTPAAVHFTKYPFAGRTSHQVTLGVYNSATNKTIFLETGEPKEHYLTCVTWSPDEKYIYIALLNREQNHLWLNQYDAQSGAFVQTLFEETDPKYVHPQHALYFLPGKTDEFVWWSQRDGYMHLYRYNTSGKLLNQVTKGTWVVNEIVGADAKTKRLYITTSKESPLNKNLYAVQWTNGNMRRIDKTDGTHTVYLNHNAQYIIDQWSNDTTPPTIDLYTPGRQWSHNLLTSKDPLQAYDRPQIENVTLKADDGTPLYGKIIYPTHFDRSKKYPVIVYLYNGPGVKLLSNRFPASGNLWYEYMAQRGYIVFTMDGRGSTNRGLAFEQAVFRQLGTVEMDDQMKGVEYLKALPFVDEQRMGIHGWSYGGFMTTSFMLRKPDVFAVGVAGGPVIDWKLYEVMYTERYMDTPQGNPAGYEAANLLSKVGDLKGKLLLIHGSIDSTVVWQHSMKFLKAAIDQDVQVDYFVYPGHEHNVRGYDRIHLMQKITDYFDLYLNPEEETR